MVAFLLLAYPDCPGKNAVKRSSVFLSVLGLVVKKIVNTNRLCYYILPTAGVGNDCTLK